MWFYTKIYLQTTKHMSYFYSWIMYRSLFDEVTFFCYPHIWRIGICKTIYCLKRFFYWSLFQIGNGILLFKAQSLVFLLFRVLLTPQLEYIGLCGKAFSEYKSNIVSPIECFIMYSKINALHNTPVVV